MAHTVADFEMAVLCAFQYAGASLADAQAQALKQQAEAYCAGVKASADNWRLCLELFANSPHDQAKFYALQTLQALLASGAIADDAVAAQLRSELLAWLRTHAAAVDTASPFLKTKLAVVLTLLIKRDYPDRWPTAFTELMALLPTGASMVELFFRILTEINTEIVEFDASRTALEAQHNMRIKDAMRESACMAETFDAIYNVLVNADVSDVMTRLSVSALDVLKRYIAWVDISLIVNDRFVPLLFQLLRNSPALRCAAANCIFEVVDKGMTPAKKLALLSQLRLLDVVRELPIQDDEEFAVEVAEIVNGMGLELIECIDAFRHEQQRALLVDASTMLGQLMPLVWELFAHETKNVSEEVFEVVNSVGTQIRAESEGPLASGSDELFQPTAYLPQILHGIYRQIRYPEDHDDTDEAEFEEYRRSLFKIYVNITRKRPLETLGFLANLSIQVPAQVQLVEPRTVEAFISLVHRYMEGIAATKAKKDLESPSSVLTGIVIRIHSNMIALATLPGVPPVPPSVLLAYYDLAQRYSRVLQNQSQLIPALLDMMFGVHGLTNQHARVRSRVCYLCLQLVKSIGQSIHPHVENILRALVPQLVVRPDEDEATSANDPTYIPYDDQVYLFELAGQVIASLVSAGEAMTTKYEYTKQVLEPLVAALNATLTALSNGSLEEEQAASHCGKLLNAIANVSKAFKTVNCMANQQELFTSVLNGTAFVLRTMPRHRSVRSKVVFALHRFVAILDSDHLLANVSEILEHLMFGCDATDVLEIVQLLDQLIIRYKVLLFPFFDPFTMPFVKHLCDLMPPRTLSAGASESETKDAAQLEREAVQKYLYLFLLHVTSHNLSSVFLSPRNVAQLENVLLLVLEACGDVADAATNRAGFTIAHELVSKWLLAPQPLDGLTDEIKKSFTQVMVTRFVPTMFTIAQKPHFEVHDAQCAAVMKEIRTLHEVLLRALGDEFLCYLRDVCLPSLGCPPEIAVAYAQQVATGDDKVIMAAYKQLVSRMK